MKGCMTGSARGKIQAVWRNAQSFSAPSCEGGGTKNGKSAVMGDFSAQGSPVETQCPRFF